MKKRKKLNEMRFMGNSQSRFGSNKVGIRTRAPAEENRRKICEKQEQ